MRWRGDRGRSATPVYHAMLELLEALSDRPDRVCVRTDDVTIELDWRAPSPAPSPAPPGAPPAAPPASTEPEQAPDADPGMRYVCAPSVGTVYQAHEPGAPPFVTVGSTGTAGQQVGIVEVMKLMIPVEADVAGTVVEVLIDDCVSVEHGQPLLALAPSQTS